MTSLNMINEIYGRSGVSSALNGNNLDKPISVQSVGTRSSATGMTTVAAARTTSTTSALGSSVTTSVNKSTSGSSSMLTTASFGTDVKGLDISGITAIKNAIQSFVKGYSSKASAVSTTTATIQQAVKGTTSERLISNLSDSIKSGVMQSLNKLNKFSNQLDTVKSSYSKADSNNGSLSSSSVRINRGRF